MFFLFLYSVVPLLWQGLKTIHLNHHLRKSQPVGNEVQKPYILEYMQRYSDFCKCKVNGVDLKNNQALHKQNVMVRFWRWLHPLCPECNFNGRLFHSEVHNKLNVKINMYKCDRCGHECI